MGQQPMWGGKSGQPSPNPRTTGFGKSGQQQPQPFNYNGGGILGRLSKKSGQPQYHPRYSQGKSGQQAPQPLSSLSTNPQNPSGREQIRAIVENPKSGRQAPAPRPQFNTNRPSKSGLKMPSYYGRVS